MVSNPQLVGGQLLGLRAGWTCPRPRPPPPPLLSRAAQAIIKPQYVDHIPKAVKGKVGEIFTSKNQLGTMDSVLNEVGHSGYRVCVYVAQYDACSLSSYYSCWSVGSVGTMVVGIPIKV